MMKRVNHSEPNARPKTSEEEMGYGVPVEPVPEDMQDGSSRQQYTCRRTTPIEKEHHQMAFALMCILAVIALGCAVGLIELLF